MEASAVANGPAKIGGTTFDRYSSRRDPTRENRDLVAPRNEGVQGSSARVDFGKRRRLNRSGPQEGRTGRCILRRRMCVGDFMSRTFSIAVFMSGT
jgi:hypothetical protein